MNELAKVPNGSGAEIYTVCPTCPACKQQASAPSVERAVAAAQEQTNAATDAERMISSRIVAVTCEICGNSYNAKLHTNRRNSAILISLFSVSLLAGAAVLLMVLAALTPGNIGPALGIGATACWVVLMFLLVKYFVRPIANVLPAQRYEPTEDSAVAVGHDPQYQQQVSKHNRWQRIATIALVVAVALRILTHALG